MWGGVKAGNKDPRRMVQNARAFSPAYQPDQYQFLQDQVAAQGNFVPLDDAMKAASATPANQSRIQCDYAPFRFSGLLLEPYLLVPRNPNRSNLYVANLTTAVAVMISFGLQKAYNNFPGFFLSPFGTKNATFSEGNSVTGVNEVWLIPTIALHINILAYEGTPVIGGSA